MGMLNILRNNLNQVRWSAKRSISCENLVRNDRKLLLPENFSCL